MSTSAIVVGVDGSEPSKLALRWAAYLAASTGSDLDVVHVWQPFSTYGWAGLGWAPVLTDWNPAETAEKALVAAVDEVFRENRPTGMTLTVQEGNPAQALIEKGAAARMIVVGSRGHGGFAGLLLGSVSAACSEHAACPVLVVRGQGLPPTP